MAKILNIEVGNLITRVAEMDSKVKNPKVYSYFSFPTPAGVVEDGFVRENPEFIMAMKAGLHENKIKTKTAVFVVSSTKIVTREVTIPSIKQNQLGTYIKANANDYFPIDLSVYEIAHVLLGTEVADDGKERFRVLVMAAGKDLIAGYNTLASACGLKLNSVEYIGNSVYQVMKVDCGDTATLVVRIEDNVTIASVIAGGSMILQRTLAYGIERAAKAVVDSPEYYESDYASAFKLMCQKACLKVTLNDRTRVIERDDAPFENDHAEEARTKVTATFGQLIGNLVRVSELYNSKEPLNPIKKVVLIGIGSEIINLPKLFRNELGIETVVLQEFSAVSVTKVGEESLSRYAGVFGAALDPVGLVSDSKKSKEKKQANYPLYTLCTFVVMMLALVVLFLKAYLPYNDAVKEEKRLKDLESKYAEAEVVHERFQAVETLYSDLTYKYAMTEHPNDGMLQFFQELEKKLPNDVSISSFTSNSEKTSLVVHVADYEEGAKVLQILRTFEGLRSVNITGISEGEKKSTDEEEENPGIDFEIVCTYYPTVETTEE